MKIIIRIIIAALFSYVGLKFLLPHYLYPIEHFEQWLVEFLPFSWKVTSILARVIVGLFFVIAFFLLFYWEKIKWMKYVSVLMIFIPFIINPVFPENFKDLTKEYNENAAFEIQNPEKETILVYVSAKCSHCKEAMIELDIAKKKSEKFSEVKVISYNSKIQEFINDEELDLQLDTIPTKLFLKITKGSFPKFQLVKENKILKKWSNNEFNYAVLDNLSK